MNVQDQKQNTQLTEDLIEVLESLVKAYRQLLKVFRSEKTILSSPEIDELNENNKIKEDILVKLGQLEKSRIKMTEDLCASLLIKTENVRLLEIAKYVEKPFTDKLYSLHSVLELLIKRVKEINDENESLVQMALESVTGAMKNIKETLSDEPTYERKGEVSKKSNSSGQLVSREA